MSIPIHDDVKQENKKQRERGVDVSVTKAVARTVTQPNAQGRPWEGE